jgi:alkylation response protein AidB-like acyl-CoA dehydrogenase
MHGAIGYTVEHDLHLFMKRAWALSRHHGSHDHHRAVVRRALLG